MEREPLSFEDALQELEAIVNALEAGPATLEEALELYERGIHLAAHCESLLERAELRVRVLRQNEDGEVELQDVDAEALDTWSEE
ncbi:MAG: exodeoxyribonuclease VII small subunit [Ardenticatenia bacterium]|nr:exodeoxyribonuclease VII small subunit [Ardenticatenia bacterium]